MAIITPTYTYPHTEVTVTDNSSRNTAITSTPDGVQIFCPFISPKGRDNKIITFKGTQADFVKKFGIGSRAAYGQPLLNAYNACGSNFVTLQCERLMPTDATYANTYVVVRYRYTAATAEPVAPATIHIQFVEMTSAISDLASAKIGGENGRTVAETIMLDPTTFEESTDEDAVEYSQFVLFSCAYMGRGTYGNNLAIRFDAAPKTDKSSGFRNYNMKFIDSNTIIESLTTRVSFYEDAMANDSNIFVESVINDDNDVDYVLYFNTAAYKTFYSFYASKNLPNANSVVPYKMFDIMNFLNADNTNNTTAVSTTALALSLGFTLESVPDALGYNLSSGEDGSIANVDPTLLSSSTTLTGAALVLETLYYDAFMGVSSNTNSAPDTNVKSRNKVPFRFTFDADFSGKIKYAMTRLAANRLDHVAILDAGVNLVGKTDAYDVFTNTITGIEGVSALSSINDWHCDFEGYMLKDKDPVTKRIIPLTATYHLIRALPEHKQTYGDWSIPYAGGTYGIMTNYTPNTCEVAFDDDLDAAQMQKMYDAGINYAQVTPKGEIIRATQNTMYNTTEALGELSNALVVLDIKEAVEKIVYKYGYNFNRASDLARFNLALKNLTDSYAGSVKTIKAEFDSTDEEAEAGVLHLYIGIVYHELVKINMVDITIN